MASINSSTSTSNGAPVAHYLFAAPIQHKSMCIYVINQSTAGTACSQNRPELVDGLFENRSNVYYGLLGACFGGHMDLVKRLIEHFDKEDTFDEALTAAAAGGHRAIVDLLIGLGAGNHKGALFAACENGHLELAEHLVNTGVSPDEGLDGACCGGNIEIARRMIALGAKISDDTIWAAKRGENQWILEAVTAA